MIHFNKNPTKLKSNRNDLPLTHSNDSTTQLTCEIHWYKPRQGCTILPEASSRQTATHTCSFIFPKCYFHHSFQQQIATNWSGLERCLFRGQIFHSVTMVKFLTSFSEASPAHLVLTSEHLLDTKQQFQSSLKLPYNVDLTYLTQSPYYHIDSTQIQDNVRL